MLLDLPDKRLFQSANAVFLEHRIGDVIDSHLPWNAGGLPGCRFDSWLVFGPWRSATTFGCFRRHPFRSAATAPALTTSKTFQDQDRVLDHLALNPQLFQHFDDVHRVDIGQILCITEVTSEIL